MKKIVLIALALAASACTSTHEDHVGWLHGTWTVTLDGNAVAACADVGAAKVEFLTTFEETLEGVADRFPCDELEGTTADLAVGDYTVVVSILDSADAAIDSFPAQGGIPVAHQDTTELGTFDFAFQSP